MSPTSPFTLFPVCLFLASACDLHVKSKASIRALTLTKGGIVENWHIRKLALGAYNYAGIMSGVTMPECVTTSYLITISKTYLTIKCTCIILLPQEYACFSRMLQ